MNDMASTTAAGEKKYLERCNKAGYGSDDVAGNVVYVLLSAFVIIYPTDTAGLNAGVVDTPMTVSQLFDGSSDVIFGALPGRAKARVGRTWPWILWSSVGCVGMIVATFAVPAELDETARYVWFPVAYTLLNTVFYTANNIAYSSLTTLITRNGSERAQMGSIRFIFAFGMNLLIRSIMVGGMAMFGGSAAGWRTMVIAYALLGLAVSILSVFSAEKLSPEELAGDDDARQKDGTLTVLESAGMLLPNKCYLLTPVVLLLTQTFTAMLNMDIYFMEHTLGDKNLLGTLTRAVNIPLIVGLLVTPIIAKKLGEVYRVNLGGYVIATLGRLRVLAAIYFHNIPLMLVLSAVASLGMSPLQGTSNTMIAEASEHTRLRTGKRTGGLMFSCTSLGMKVSGGTGTAMAGWPLTASSCNGGLSMQPDLTAQVFYVVHVRFPLIANALIFLLLIRLDVEKANVRPREQVDT